MVDWFHSAICETWVKYSMAKSRTDMMIDRLRELQSKTPDVEASAVGRVEGLTIRVSAMSAAMLSLGERIAGELGRGILAEVYIHGNEGYVLLTSVGRDAVLTVLARQQAKLGLVFLEMRRAAQDLLTLVG
jgi:predicted regulator of Ras-like GTPase activity (Roadblock/LC7/MglB family)